MMTESKLIIMTYLTNEVSKELDKGMYCNITKCNILNEMVTKLINGDEENNDEC